MQFLLKQLMRPSGRDNFMIPTDLNLYDIFQAYIKKTQILDLLRKESHNILWKT